MSDQPEALRLADVLDAHQFDEPHAAAACLRRQHAEIESLKAERDALLEVLTELANSLPSAEYMRQQGQEEGPLLRKMRAVIANATGENK